jgi:hypothetical protein
MRKGVVRKAFWSCRMFFGSELRVTWDSPSSLDVGLAA